MFVTVTQPINMIHHLKLDTPSPSVAYRIVDMGGELIKGMSTLMHCLEEIVCIWLLLDCSMISDVH